jgi:transcriptional regulator with XRE-family HTH domain
LLGWSQDELAKAAKISGPTVRRVETDQGVKVSEASLAAIQRALESAGVIFVEENGEGPGVRLRKGKRK